MPLRWALRAANPIRPQGDPAGAKPGETELRVRPLVVDGKVKEWTTGEAHDVTERSFAVRRAVRLNDALPTDKAARWIWQRGPWLLVDRTSGKVAALHLPDFDPAVSEVVWFRDYAAYCGVSASGKQLLAVVAQVEARRPLLAKKLGVWDAADHPSPVCAPAVWQRDPLKVTFQPGGTAGGELRPGRRLGGAGGRRRRYRLTERSAMCVAAHRLPEA